MSRRSTLLFDGDCGFCTWIIDRVRRWLRPQAEIVPWQFADLGVLGVTAEQCSEALQWIDASGRVSSGGEAVVELLRHSRQPWPLVGAVAGAPGLSMITAALYRLVARNRYRLPGSTPACALTAPGAAAA